MRRYLIVQTACIVGALLLWSPAAGQDSLLIHHLDVDQGDATLVVAPNGRTMLVDAGLDSKGEVVAEFLEERGLESLDAFVLTHYDGDHYGGADVLVEEGIEVEIWYDRNEVAFLPEEKTSQDQFQQYAAAADSPIKLMSEDTIHLDSALTVTVVASNGHVRGAVGKHPIDGLDENGYSVSLLISYRGFNYFVGGDLTREVEVRIVEEAALGDLDLLKVNHHGSATSSSHAFLQAIRPEVAVISNGSHGGFNHPRQAVLDTLEIVEGIDVYQTNRLQEEDLDNRGRIAGGNVPDGFIADPESEDSDGTITVVVKGDSYRVEMPAREISRDYEIE